MAITEFDDTFFDSAETTEPFNYVESRLGTVSDAVEALESVEVRLGLDDSADNQTEVFVEPVQIKTTVKKPVEGVMLDADKVRRTVESAYPSNGETPSLEFAELSEAA